MPTLIFRTTTTMKTSKLTHRGFTLVEIMIVVAIIGLLVTIAIPNYVKSRELTQKNACLSNLRVIDTAKQVWAIETGKGSSDVAADADLVGIGLYMRRKPICPADGDYSYLAVSAPPACSAPGHVFAP
jgi:prepilin-type N-terminal cleavage/methylation domain-containing protein